MDKKDKATDQRLQREYGISLEEYNTWLAERGGVCEGCGTPPKSNKRLAVDHDHKVAKAKIILQRSPILGWMASSGKLVAYSGTRSEARYLVQKLLKRKSFRGFLCWGCNTALQKFRDNPDRMEKAAAYIRRYQEKLIG